MVHACFLDLSKAFDKVLYDKLFLKLLDRGIPAIIARVLVFAYEEQQAWVRLASRNSDPFPIKNGTRQGSVLSPSLFGIYSNELLQKLRKTGVGCHVAGVWMAAIMYADDLVLLCPDRVTLQKLVKVCEDYGAEHNLVFSTDPNPAKSKTKCLLFRGKRRVPQPGPVLLDGEPLPWCSSYEHLGHKLSEDITMNSDAARAKSSFNSRADDIRAQLYFAHPKQKIKAIELYCSDAYGLNLYDLKSQSAETLFKAWNRQVKLCFNISIKCHTNIVEQYLCSDLVSLRRQVLARYPGFVRKLLQSRSREIQFLSNFVINDHRSVTCRNISHLNDQTGLNVLREAKWKVRAALPHQSSVPVEEWRCSLLSTFLEIRSSKTHSLYNSTESQINQMIDSLCNS